MAAPLTLDPGRTRARPWSAGSGRLAGLVGVLLLCRSGLGSPTPPVPGGADAVVELLEHEYSQADTLRADFVIETVNEMMGEVEVESGVLFASRPDRMKWQYRDPPGKVLLLDGTYQWLFLPSEGQAFRGEQDEVASDLTLALLADPGTLQSRFEVELDPGDGSMPGLRALRLVPLRPDLDVKSVVLGVDAQLGLVRLIELTDSFEKLTRIRFSDVELSVRISDDLFRLKLPRGTALLDFEGLPIEE